APRSGGADRHRGLRQDGHADDGPAARLHRLQRRRRAPAGADPRPGRQRRCPLAPPLALAVVRHAAERALEIPAHEECEILVGQGVRADMRGNRILVGSARLLGQFGLAVPPQAEALAQRLSLSGETPLYVAYNDQTLGVLGIADQLRPETAQALAALRDVGIERIVMLTGDGPEVA